MNTNYLVITHKVGYSERDPENRARELDSTALPHPHEVVFAVLVEDAKSLERVAHEKLSHFHEAKEWFRCSPQQAKNVVSQLPNNPIITHGSLSAWVPPLSARVPPSRPVTSNPSAPHDRTVPPLLRGRMTQTRASQNPAKDI